MFGVGPEHRENGVNEDKESQARIESTVAYPFCRLPGIYSWGIRYTVYRVSGLKYPGAQDSGL